MYDKYPGRINQSLMAPFIQGAFSSVPTLPISTAKTHIKKPERNTDTAKKLNSIYSVVTYRVLGREIFVGGIVTAQKPSLIGW